MHIAERIYVAASNNTHICYILMNVQGVTHTARLSKYPEDPATDTPHRWVSHFAHPIELEWVSRGKPPANKYPVLFFQVMLQRSVSSLPGT